MIPDSVTKIDKWAFESCKNLTSFAFPEKVTTIPEGVLEHCENLTSVLIPEGVTRIDRTAFLETGITNVALPSTLVSIGDSAFSKCNSLTSIVIPDSVEKIEHNAFEGCRHLSSVKLSDSLTEIEKYMFYNCTELREVSLPLGVTKLGSSVFSGCTNLTVSVIPPEVTVIPDSLFENCEKLESVTIPEGVTEIKERAFSCCGLKSVTLPQTLVSVGTRAFSTCSELTNIVIPESVTSIGTAAFEECKTLSSVKLPSTLTRIEEHMFKNCKALADISIPQSVTSIGFDVFYGSNLTSVNIPDSVTEIGGGAFSYCKELSDISIPQSVTTIGGYAFSDCTALSSIVIPDSVTEMGKGVFSGCTALTGVVIPNNVTEVSESLCSGCTALTSVKLPANVTAIGGYAFSACPITSIDLPSTVTSIGRYAFSDCKKLSSVNIKDSASSKLSSIGDCAFSSCSSLNILYIPDSVEEIEDDTFRNHSELFTIQCSPGSYAQEYAESHSINCEFSVGTSNGMIIVNIPEGYIGQQLRLINEGSERTVCTRLINGKRLMIYGVDPSSLYRAELVSDKGSVFAVLEGIKPDNSDTGVSFTNAKPVCGITLVIKGSGGADLTDSCKIQWYTESGEFLGMGSTLTGAAQGESFRYTVSFMYGTLRESYYLPEEQTIAANKADTKADLQLGEIPDAALTGKVTDDGGRAVKGASVSLTQTFGENSEKTITAVTGSDGTFTLFGKDVPSKIIIKKQGHVTYSETFESIPAEDLDVTIDRTEMAGVDLNITKRELDGENSIPVTGDFELSVKNTSNGKDITDFYISNSRLMLPLSEVGQNDYVKVTVSCAGFETRSDDIRLSSDTEVSVELIPYGKLRIAQKDKENKESAAVLFADSDSRCVMTLDLKKQSALSDSLPDGSYTVIMMNKSGRYSSPRTLSDFEKFGLEENKDYIRAKVTIEKGKTATLENVVIPELDTNKASVFDRSKTSVKVNKSSVTLGQYIVYNIKYALKSDVKAENMKLELSIPTNALQSDKNSITVDGKVIYYNNYGSSGLSVPLTERSGCVIVALKTKAVLENCVVTAGISFRNDAGDQNETIDSVSIAINDFRFWLPQLTASTKVYSQGTVLPNKKVEYYDNGVLAGTAYSNKAGDYTIDFELIEPREHSYHEIYAVIDTNEGPLKTGTRYLEYMKDAVIPEKLDVYKVPVFGEAGERDRVKIMSINFLSSDENDLSYEINSHWSNNFLFEVFFGGDPSKVTYAAVLSTGANGEIIRIPLSFDEKKGAFTGGYNFSVENRPAEISVDYKAEQKELVDYDAAYAKADELYGYMDEYNAAAEQMNTAAKELEEASVITKEEMVSYLKDYGFTDETIALLDLDELLETANTELQDYITQVCDAGDEACAQETAEIDEVLGELNALFENREMTGGIFEIDESVTAQQLLDEGYVQVGTYSDKGLVFERGSDKNKYDLIDLTRRYAVVYPESGYDKLPGVSGGCADCDHHIISPVTWADVAKDIAKIVQPAAKCLKSLLNLINTFQKSRLGFLNSVLDTYKVTVPDGLGSPTDISNPQLKFLAEKVVGSVAANQYVQKAIKFNAALQAVLAPLTAVCEAVLALSDLGDISAMIERLAPHLCSCTTYSNSVTEDAINDIFFQLSAIAADVTACSVPVFNSLYDLAKSGWRVIFNGLGNLKLLDKKTVQSLTDPFAYGRERTKERLILAERFLSDCKCDSNDAKDGIIVSSAIDPSGFICEAVESNRLEGVTTTLWYSESEDGSNAVVWDAEEWSQENPLISDDNGHYEWYVPEGWWQVEFEKEGYEKTYSDWVPVLPVQTEVNVSMKSLCAPEVQSINAYNDCVDITFSQYMDIYSVSTETVKVSKGGKTVAGKLEPLNAEPSFTNSRTQYASKFRFVPNEELGGSVNVTVDKVRSYNGLYLDTAYTADSAVARRITKIDAPSRFVMLYNGSSDIEIQLLPADLGADVDVKVSSADNDALEISSDTVRTDANGKAAVTLKGKLPAHVELTFSLPDAYVSAVTTVILSEDPDNEKTDVGCLGDLDGDSAITANDALTILRASVGLSDLADDQTKLADIDADGQITANDALAVLRYSVGMAEDDSPINKPLAA